MRKIIVISMVSLDGVLQGPGGPTEDNENGFRYGGWIAPFNDVSVGNLMMPLMEPADLLLGRKTFDIWENYWPKHAEFWPGVNEVTKYVLSSTRDSSTWSPVVFLSDLEAVKQLKNSEGGPLKVWGSSELVHLLLAEGMVDELWMLTHPLILGEGKQVFAPGSKAQTLELVQQKLSDKGVIVAQYRPKGDVECGTVGPE